MKPNHQQLSATNHPYLAISSLANSATNSNHIRIDFSPSADEVARKVYICHGNQSLHPDDELQRWLEAEAQLLAEVDATPGDTAIKSYLREIAKFKPLTAQAEIELSARVKKGDKKAREQMIKANLPLVVKIARGFEGNGLPLLDLISEGNIGLMKAVGRFDPAQGNKLGKCGSRWIKDSMSQALANQSKVHPSPAR